MEEHVVKRSEGEDLKFRGKKIASTSREMTNLSISSFLMGKRQALWELIQIYRTEEGQYVVAARDSAGGQQAFVCSGPAEVVAALKGSGGEMCWLARDALLDAGGELQEELSREG